jgi:hypothetical protein
LWNSGTGEKTDHFFRLAKEGNAISKEIEAFNSKSIEDHSQKRRGRHGI